MSNEKELITAVSKIAKVNTSTKTIVVNNTRPIGIKLHGKLEALVKYYNYTLKMDNNKISEDVDNNYNIKHNQKEKYTLTNKRK